MRLLFVGLWLVGTGCSGDAPPAIDANPLGPRCSMVTYDLCIEEHDCSPVQGRAVTCQNFSVEMIQVCTVSCSAANPCPEDRTGAAGTCDTGVCRPAQPNMCHL